MNPLDLLGMLTLGLLGGAGHCVGMCSPFVLFVSRRYAGGEGRRSVPAAQLWYTAGRITTYAGLGAVAGAAGSLVQMTGALLGVQRAAAVVGGLTLGLWAIASLLDLAPRSRGCGGWMARVTAGVNMRTLGHPYAMGLMLGLLPCGLLYTAAIAASTKGTAVSGALALAVFGVGTAPALLGLSLADRLLTCRRASLNRLSQAFALAMGAWFVWRGLSG